MCARIAVFYQARRVSGHTCVRIAVFYQVRRVSGHTCVRIAVFYQARRVSGHICVLGLQCFTRPGESVVIYMCLGVSMLSLFLRLYFGIVPTVWYILFLILSCHICVLGLRCFTRPGE